MLLSPDFQQSARCTRRRTAAGNARRFPNHGHPRFPMRMHAGSYDGLSGCRRKPGGKERPATNFRPKTWGVDGDQSTDGQPVRCIGRFSVHTSGTGRQVGRRSRFSASGLREAKRLVTPIFPVSPASWWQPRHRCHVNVYLALGFRLLYGVSGGISRVQDRMTPD